MIVLFLVMVMAVALLMWGNLAQDPYTPFSFLTKPLINDQDQVMFKTENGMYITVCNDCKSLRNVDTNHCKYMLCLRKEPYNSSVFTLHRHPDNYWSIETVAGKFWKRCSQCSPDCTDMICADGINKDLRTHKFHLIKNPDGTIRWRTDMGRFIESSSCNQSCGKIMCGQGLGGDINLVVEKVRSTSKPAPTFDLTPNYANVGKRVPDGVLLSTIQ